MKIVCLDLEGVLLPEIWKKVGKKTEVEELEITTKEAPDYRELMKHRFEHLERNGIKIEDIRDIISEVEPLPGAEEFMSWLRDRVEVSIITGSFYQFLIPLIDEFDWPIVFGRNIYWDEDGYLNSFHPKSENLKVKTVTSFRNLGMETMVVGDSYNDIGMLEEADFGVLFRPSKEVKSDHPHFSRADDYEGLKGMVKKFLSKK